MDRLPLELVKHIFRLAGEAKDDVRGRSERCSVLRCCALVCSGWRDLVQAELLREITMYGRPGNWERVMACAPLNKGFTVDLLIYHLAGHKIALLLPRFSNLRILHLQSVQGLDPCVWTYPSLCSK